MRSTQRLDPLSVLGLLCAQAQAAPSITSYNITGYSPGVRVILKALQKYGMILADKGSNRYLFRTRGDERRNNNLLSGLKDVPGSAFEAVDVSSLTVGPDSGPAVVP